MQEISVFFYKLFDFLFFSPVEMIGGDNFQIFFYDRQLFIGFKKAVYRRYIVVIAADKIYAFVKLLQFKRFIEGKWVSHEEKPCNTVHA